MEKQAIKVDGMSCEHCISAITKVVGVLPGVFDVAVDLASKTVTVTYDPSLATLGKIKHEIDEQGFDVID